MSEAQKFQDSNIVVELQKLPNCKIKMNISISPEMSKEAYDKAFKEVKKLVSIPGFRKGKAPEQVIRSSFGDRIEKHWQQNLHQDSLEAACKLVGQYPLKNAPPVEISISDLKRDEPSTIVAEFESTPKAPEIDIDNISISAVEPNAVTDSDIDARLEEFRRLYASWTNISDRGLHEGDYVELDIGDEKDATLFYCENQTFIYAKDKMPSWIYNPLQGKKTAENVTATSERSDELEADAEFTPTPCIITVKKIMEIDPPALDDDFAKKLGETSLEGVRNRIREMLKSTATKDARNQFEKNLLDFLIASYPFDLPRSYIENQQKVAFGVEKNRLQNADLSAEQRQAHYNYFVSVYDAERILKRDLLLSKIALILNIQLSPNDVVKMISSEDFDEADNKQALFENTYRMALHETVIEKMEEKIKSR